MSDADAFYIDGTFSTCPSLFYQVCDTDFFFFLVDTKNVILLNVLSTYAGVHYPHSAIWAYLSDGILPFAQQTEADIQQSIHATQG